MAAVEDVITHCHLSLSMPDQPVYLEADPARLEQIIVNLLTNAAKYTPEGGKIWLSAQQERCEVVIRCRDTGQGLSAEMIDAIFQPFVQFRSSADHGRTGLGMGLTLVKNLVEMHGGSTKASSEGLGKGSEFVLRLPAGSQQVSQISADTRQPISSEVTTEPCKILVVDDNRDLAESLGVFLQGVGHEALLAHDGESAISIAARDQPDIVLLDIGLPGMDGFAVADRLRAMPGLKRTRIAAISGHKAPEAAEINSARFDAYFVKPLVHEELLEFLRTPTVEVKGA
jgi:CheY-like chemotaxis protein